MRQLALSARCARTGGTYAAGPCLARPTGCAYCQLGVQTQTAPVTAQTRRTRT